MQTLRHRPSRYLLRTRRAFAGIVGVWLAVLVLSLAVCSSRSIADNSSSQLDGELAAAADELEAVRQRAEAARAAAEKAKRELDRYVARHFEEQESRAEEPILVPELPKPKPAPEDLPPPAIEAEWLLGQIQRLKLERASLLSRYTPAHPQVVELEVRLADMRRQLAEAHEGRVPDDAQSSDDDAESSLKREWTDRLGADKDRDRQSVSQYRKALARWQKAQRQAKAAAEAEALAAEKMSEAEAQRKRLPTDPELPRETERPPVVELRPEEQLAIDEPPPVESPLEEPIRQQPELAPAPAAPRPAIPQIVPPPAVTQADPAPNVQIPMRSIPVTPPAAPPTQPSPDLSGRNDLNRGQITVTNPEPDRSPATYFPAGTQGQSREESPEEPPKAKRSAVLPGRTNRDLLDPSVSLAEPQSERPSERLLAPRREPPVVESPAWTNDSIIDSAMVDEALLDEPFLMEHEIRGRLADQPILPGEPGDVRADTESGLTDATSPDDDAPEGSQGAPLGVSRGGGAPRFDRESPIDARDDVPSDWPSAVRDRMSTPAAPPEVEGDDAVPEGERQLVSQPFALAAIVVAIVVAIAASIWLARSSSEGVFPTAEAVKSGLDLPLAGVVPAARPQPHRRKRMPRGIVLVGQIVLALAVFGAVAYAISTPGLMEQFCSESIATLDRAWTSVRTR